MTDVETLAAIAGIRALKSRYCRFMDEKNWTGWGELFAPDATLETPEDLAPGDLPKVTGRAAIVAHVSGSVGQAVTCHHVHEPEIELTSDAAAKGIWGMEDLVIWPEPVVSPIDPIRKLQGWGHYRETYERRDGRWYIKTLLLTRLHRALG